MPEGEYLAFLCMKHSVDPDKFFQALISAVDQQGARCGSLSIQCRGRNRFGRIFLIMDSSRVVAQVKISEEFLSEKSNPIGKFKDCERIRRYLTKIDKSSFKLSDIVNLRVGMTGINLSAKVLEVGEPTSVYTRSGSQGVVVNAMIDDGTGRVQLSLWGDQTGSVSVGDTVQIINARMLAFRGVKQLRIGGKGTLKVERENSISA